MVSRKPIVEAANASGHLTPDRLVKALALVSLGAVCVYRALLLRINYHPIGYAASGLLGHFRHLENSNGEEPVPENTDYHHRFTLCAVLVHCSGSVQGQGSHSGGTVGMISPAPTPIGSLTFSLSFGIVLLFGKRVDCGWCCPCVTARETIGFPFRDKTVRNGLWWRLAAPEMADPGLCW